jgi:hypothetical protein
MAHVEKDMDPKQRVAICYSQWERHTKHNSEFLRKVELLNGDNKWTRLKDFLLIEKAELLGPGTWTGLDGIPTKYSEAVIKDANNSILGKPIKITHADNAETVVGFWDAVKDSEGKTFAQGIVWHPVGVKYFEDHPNAPLSIEADAKCKFDPNAGTDEVLAMVYEGGAAVENPAYPSGGVEQQRHLTLSARIELNKTDGNEIKEKGNEKDMDSNFDKIELSEQEKTALKSPFFANKDVKMTKEEALAFFETQLKNAKVPDDKIKYTVALLSKTLTNEFPLPTIPTPPTPPVPLSAAPEKKPEEIAPDDKLAKEVERLSAELTKTNAALNTRLDEDISNTSASIKSIDNSFELGKYVEGITDKTLQKKMLSSHLESLKRVSPKPITLKLSSDDAKKKANEASKEMFGLDLSELFQQTVRGKDGGST